MGLERYKDGNREWFNSKGECHRTDGPAIERNNGDRYWYQDGDRHRLDGPALECNDGSKYWFKNDKLHRLDGPAIESFTGHKEWWIDGVDCYTEKEYNKNLQKIRKEIV